MSMKLKLSTRITCLVLLPFIAFAFATWSLINSSWEQLTAANHISTNMEVIEAGSAFVNELQKERGMSVAYLAGSGDLGAVTSQRKAVDNTSIKFRELLQDAYVPQQTITGVLAALDSIPAARNAVNSKGNTKSILSQYTNVV